jgi:hypothetical protein
MYGVIAPILLLFLSSARFSVGISSCSVQVAVSGGGFEAPVIAAGTFAAANLSAWGNASEHLGSGASCLPGCFRFDYPMAPEGVQYLIVQRDTGAVMPAIQQTLALPAGSTTLAVSFFYAKRLCCVYSPGSLSVRVSLNGALAHSFVPPEIESWALRSFDAPVSGSTVLLSIEVYNSQLDDQTVFFDAITVTAGIPVTAGSLCGLRGLSVCPPGSFCAGGVATACPAGRARSAPGSSSENGCIACPAGAYSPAGAASCAYNASTCPVGTYASPPSSCAPCSPATACTVAGLSAQPPCYWNVSTLAGNGTAGWADGQGTAAMFSYPHGVSVDPVSLNLYAGDSSGHRVRRITPLGLVETVAGLGGAAFADGVGSAAAFFLPVGVSADFFGKMYVADSENCRIRKILPSGVVSTLAGNGTAGGVNGIGTAALFIGPTDIALDASGTMGFIVDQNGHTIRSVLLSTASVSTLAGSGAAGFADGTGTSAQFNAPTSAVWHPSGKLYIADGYSGNNGLGGNNRIRCTDIASAVVSTLAGSGAAGGSNGVGTAASFHGPRGVALDATFSTLYVAEQFGNRVRAIALSTALVSTIAGAGARGLLNAFGVDAVFNWPLFIASAPSGALYTTDYNNNCIRELTCVPCPASYFCASGAPVLCPAGSFCPLSSVSPTPCPAGTYSAAPGAATSAACRPCPAGTSSPNTGASLPSACAPCGSPYYCPAGAAAPLPCPPGTFGDYSQDPEKTKTSACAGFCSPGYFGASPARVSNDGSCDGACPPGTFSGLGATSCAPCPAGNFTPFAASAACPPCAAGGFCPRGSASVTPCPAGTWSAAAGAGSSAACAACAPGTFSGSGATFCSACAAGAFSGGAGAAACDSCPAGAFSAAGAAACTNCSAGTFSAVRGLPASAACAACPAGSFCPPPGGAANATPCPADTFSPSPGAANCTPCAPGAHSAPGALACAPTCPRGTFRSRGACAPCPGAGATLAQAAPLLLFAGGLLGAGALLFCVAHCSLARGGKAPPLRDSCGAVRDVLVWAWLAAQGAAALFAQAQALAPPELASYFGAVAALQFEGVTLPPQCYDAPPFAAFWAALSTVCVCCALAGGGLAALHCGATGCARAAASAALSLAALALTLGYGAVTAVTAATLVCTLPAPMTLAAYALSSSDGGALARALGAAAPPIEALRAAANSAEVAATRGLTDALQATIPVSVLASDPFTVCREGPHAAAWTAAAALAATYSLGLPAAALCALRAGGRCKGARRALAAARKAPPPPRSELPPPPPALAALLAALSDPAMLPRAAWLPPVQLLLVALFTGTVAAAVRAGDAGEFLGAQAAVALAAAAAAVLVCRLRPFSKRQEWRRPVLAALYCLTAATAVVSGALYGGRGAAPGAIQWALGGLLLVAAGGVFVALLVGWWLSLLPEDSCRRKAPAAPPPVAAAVGGAAAEGAAFTVEVGNPLAEGEEAAAARRARQQRRRERRREREAEKDAAAATAAAAAAAAEAEAAAAASNAAAASGAAAASRAAAVSEAAAAAAEAEAAHAVASAFSAAARAGFRPQQAWWARFGGAAGKSCEKASRGGGACGMPVVVEQFPSPPGCCYCDLHAREAYEARRHAAAGGGGARGAAARQPEPF